MKRITSLLGFLAVSALCAGLLSACGGSNAPGAPVPDAASKMPAATPPSGAITNPGMPAPAVGGK